MTQEVQKDARKRGFEIARAASARPGSTRQSIIDEILLAARKDRALRTELERWGADYVARQTYSQERQGATDVPVEDVVDDVGNAPRRSARVKMSTEDVLAAMMKGSARKAKYSEGLRLLNYRLPETDIRLGDATLEDLENAIDYYETQSQAYATNAQKMRFCRDALRDSGKTYFREVCTPDLAVRIDKDLRDEARV